MFVNTSQTLCDARLAKNLVTQKFIAKILQPAHNVIFLRPNQCSRVQCANCLDEHPVSSNRCTKFIQ